MDTRRHHPGKDAGVAERDDEWWDDPRPRPEWQRLVAMTIVASLVLPLVIALVVAVGRAMN